MSYTPSETKDSGVVFTTYFIYFNSIDRYSNKGLETHTENLFLH